MPDDTNVNLDQFGDPIPPTEEEIQADIAKQQESDAAAAQAETEANKQELVDKGEEEGDDDKDKKKEEEKGKKDEDKEEDEEQKEKGEVKTKKTESDSLLDSEGDEDFDPFLPKEKEEGDDDDDDDDDDLDEEDKKRIDKRVNKIIKRDRERAYQMTRNNEVDKFLNSKLGQLFQDQMEKIRSAALNPSFRNLTVEGVTAAILGPSTILKAGAKLERQRQREVKKNSTQGDTRRTEVKNGGHPDYSTMSPDEIENIALKVRTGSYKP